MTQYYFYDSGMNGENPGANQALEELAPHNKPDIFSRIELFDQARGIFINVARPYQEIGLDADSDKSFIALARQDFSDSSRILVQRLYDASHAIMLGKEGNDKDKRSSVLALFVQAQDVFSTPTNFLEVVPREETPNETNQARHRRKSEQDLQRINELLTEREKKLPPEQFVATVTEKAALQLRKEIFEKFKIDIDTLPIQGTRSELADQVARLIGEASILGARAVTTAVEIGDKAASKVFHWFMGRIIQA